MYIHTYTYYMYIQSQVAELMYNLIKELVKLDGLWRAKCKLSGICAVNIDTHGSRETR